MPNLSVDGIVRVNVNIAETYAVTENGCNTGLIIGDSTVISTTDRVKSYSSLSSVAAAGFSPSSDEYKAAALYFAQNPVPEKVYIGRYDSTASTGDESVVAALRACYAKNSSYYGVYYAGATDAENIALAAEIDGMGGSLMLFVDSSNSDCLVENPTTADIFTALKAAGRHNAVGIYSEVDFAGAALMGLCCGLETGNVGSAFDLYFKSLSIATSDITEEQISILKAKNGNCYVVRGQDIKLIEPGACVDGVPYDETMYIALTRKILQKEVLDTITGSGVPKIPQTDAGMATILSSVTTGMEQMKDMGVYAAGVWTGDDFRSIRKGDMLSAGYAVFTDSFDTLAPVERAQRKSPPIYIAAKLAGSVRSVVINLTVNE